MPFLKLKSEFPAKVYDNANETGEQNYKGDDFFRCPYIANVWGHVEVVYYEVPLFWYVNEDESKNINEFLTSIRMSSITGKNVDLEKENKSLGDGFRDHFRVFAVDSYAIGHDIDGDLDEVLYTRPPIFMDKRGVLWLVGDNKIIATINCREVKVIDVAELSKITGEEVELIGRMLPMDVQQYPRVAVVSAGGKEELFELTLSVDLNDFKKSEVQAVKLDFEHIEL